MVTRNSFIDISEEVSSIEDAHLPAGIHHTELAVGLKIRELRNQRRLPMRRLAEMSGLSVNTLSLVENGKSSPSVSTLQRLASALKVPLTSFFESQPEQKHVVFSWHDQRARVNIGSACLENLGKDMAGHAVQPFLVTLEPGAGSGSGTIVHTGYEFVFCLAGLVLYQIGEKSYYLEPGDSIVFEAHLAHLWENLGRGVSQIILVLYTSDVLEEPGGHHFQPDLVIG